MNNRCPVCSDENGPGAYACRRCASPLVRERANERPRASIFKRIKILAAVCLAVLAAFYFSLITSAQRLTPSEKGEVTAAIDLLEARGFHEEVFLLRHLAVFRSSDNWLNASVPKESAYAATNFPFEIMTIYSDFFSYPTDDTERAAILLHEARHLAGKDEHDAYMYVWKNRQKLGWTSDKYGNSIVWTNVRRQTRDAVPELFVCTLNPLGDCTEAIPTIR